MDEPFYIPRYTDEVLKSLGKEVDILKVCAVPINIKKQGLVSSLRDYLSYFGVIIFLYMVLLRVYYLASDLVHLLFRTDFSLHSVKLVCRKHGIHYSHVDNISNKSFLDEMEKLKPDIIFSLACPQIFPKSLISIPAKGCLNIHSSLLPRYRGMNANFWVLAKGEKTTGLTIHYINPGIDDGDIILQEKIEIQESWSLNDLYHKAIDAGSRMIAKCLKTVHEDRVVRIKNDMSEGSYYTFPTGDDVKEFRKKNKRFFKYH
jgi:methionyl-tRNA formyltransferase